MKHDLEIISLIRSYNIDFQIIFTKIDPDLTFTGNGVAVTNKKGEFYFITVYPGIVEKLPPHINFRVRYKDSEFQTKIPLKGKKNKKEYHDDFSDLYEVEIVLPD